MKAQQRMTAHVSGGVQGVGFRYFVWHQARALQLTGWVRNLHDGSVEVLAEGPLPALEQLAAALRSGPPMADVQGCQLAWLPASGEFSKFEITFTA
ncbi:MAG: acylphosphatase [Anaerolineales bacterium]|nr:acylphosphatase [Anaerolineales bacterium]